MSDSVGDVVAAAWAKNRDVVLDRVQIVARALEAMQDGSLDPDARAEARSAAHKLSGSLGMYGFREASTVAARVEALLDGEDDDVRALAADVDRVASQLAGAPPTAR